MSPSDTVEVFKLAGYFAAHAIWCVEDGDTLVPIFAYKTPEFERASERLVVLTEDQSAYVEFLLQRISTNSKNAEVAVILFDTKVPINNRNVNAISLEMRCYQIPDFKVSIAIPYQPKKWLFGRFTVLTPNVSVSNTKVIPNLHEELRAFTDGIRQHPKYSKFWSNRDLDSLPSTIKVELGSPTYSSSSENLPRIKPTSGRKVRALGLRWYLNNHEYNERAVQVMLQVVQNQLPVCMPTKFGSDDHQLQTLQRHGVKGFLKSCASDVKEYGMTSWQATLPCVGGSLSVPRETHAPLLRTEVDCSTISMTFDSDVIEANLVLAQQVCDVFTSMAQELDAFYAAAYVTRDAILSDGTIWFDSSSEDIDMGRSNLWSGVPDVRTWLTWFGPELRQQLRQELPGDVLSHNGQLMRFGDIPMDADQLNPIFPRLPDHLVNLDSGYNRHQIRRRSTNRDS